MRLLVRLAREVSGHDFLSTCFAPQSDQHTTTDLDVRIQRRNMMRVQDRMPLLYSDLSFTFDQRKR